MRTPLTRKYPTPPPPTQLPKWNSREIVSDSGAHAHRVRRLKRTRALSQDVASTRRTVARRAAGCSVREAQRFASLRGRYGSATLYAIASAIIIKAGAL